MTTSQPVDTPRGASDGGPLGPRASGSAGASAASAPPPSGERRAERSDRRSWFRRPVGVRAAGSGLTGSPPPATARAALDHRFDLPVDVYDVWKIASEGFPLWEPVDVMLLRNRRITLGYADLSLRLARAIASGRVGLDANWCTFATWSSKTIGIEMEKLTHTSGYAADVLPGAGSVPTRTRDRVPGVRSISRAIARSKAASLAALATGNRAVFLEVGLAVATFLDHFPDRTFIGPDAVDRWQDCWGSVEGQLAEFAQLDPTWVMTRNPPAEDLRLGLHHYLLAMDCDDPCLRSQHVLTGNLLVATYEQQRVDGYLWAGLALFTDLAMRRLIRDRTGDVGGVRKLPSSLFACMVTRRMVLRLGGEDLRICAAIPPLNPEAQPGGNSSGARQVEWALDCNADVTLPMLQSVITRHGLLIGPRSDRGAVNWTSYDDRMRTIGNLFRLRQRCPALFAPPFDDETTRGLLAGASGIGSE